MVNSLLPGYPGSQSRTGLSYLSEAFAARWLPQLTSMLNWVQVQLPLRFAFRELALLVLLIRALPPDADRLALFAGGLLGLHVLRAVYAALVVYVNRHRTMPVVTRNIDLSEGLAGADRMAAARRELRHYLLGPDTPGPQERFNAAVAALIGDPGPAAAAAPAPAAAAAPARG